MIVEPSLKSPTHTIYRFLSTIPIQNLELASLPFLRTADSQKAICKKLSTRTKRHVSGGKTRIPITRKYRLIFYVLELGTFSFNRDGVR